MARLSQKQILSEGFGDLLSRGKDVVKGVAGRGKDVVKKKWKDAGGARGVAGLAAGIGEVIAPEMKTEVDRWKGWAKGVKTGKDRFQSAEDRLDGFLEDEGYVRSGAPRGAGEIKSIDVGVLNFYDAGPNQGEIIPPTDVNNFDPYSTPLMVKFSQNEWKIIQRPKGDYRGRQRGGGPPQPRAAPNPPGPTGPSP